MLLHCRGTEEGDSLGSRDQRLKYQCQTEALAEGRQSIMEWLVSRRGNQSHRKRERKIFSKGWKEIYIRSCFICHSGALKKCSFLQILKENYKLSVRWMDVITSFIFLSSAGSHMCPICVTCMLQIGTVRSDLSFGVLFSGGWHSSRRCDVRCAAAPGMMSCWAHCSSQHRMCIRPDRLLDGGSHALLHLQVLNFCTTIWEFLLQVKGKGSLLN